MQIMKSRALGFLFVLGVLLATGCGEERSVRSGAVENLDLVGLVEGSQEWFDAFLSADGAVTGGGSILTAGGKATFGIVGRTAPDGSPGGHVEYHDHGGCLAA